MSSVPKLVVVLTLSALVDVSTVPEIVVVSITINTGVIVELWPS